MSEPKPTKSKALAAFQAAAKTTITTNSMKEKIAQREVERKPRFDVTDEGEYQTNIVHEQALSRTSSLIGMILGRSHLSSGTAYGKFCTSTDVAYQGNLKKRGSWWHSWRDRFFVLRKDVPLLAYYATANAGERLLGSIMLCEETVVSKVSPQEADGHNYAFRVLTPEHSKVDDNDSSKKYVVPATDLLLLASNESDAHSWISEIQYQAGMSLHPRRYQNAELNWWNMLFSGRELKSYSTSKRRKGTVESEKSDKVFDKDIEKDIHNYISPVQGSTRTVVSESSGKYSHRDIDSDYSSSGDEDIVESNAEERKREKSHEKSHEKYPRYFTVKVKKPKKEKAPLPSPLENLAFSRYVTLYANAADVAESSVSNLNHMRKVAADASYHAIEGVQICLEMKNICYQNDCIFVVLLGYVHGINGSANKFIELGRTETITITESADYALSLPKCYLHFSLMQVNVPSSVDEIFCAVNRQENGQTNDNIAPLAEAICNARFPPKVFEMNTAFCSKMRVISKHHVDLTNPQLTEPECRIGILRLSSPELATARMSLGRALRLKPYAEIGYVFKATNGIIMALEQLFASQYSVLASKGLLKLFLKEREPFIKQWMHRVEARSLARESLMLTQDPTIDHLGLNMEEVIHRVHDDHLCDVQDVLEFYKSLLKRGSDGVTTNVASVLPADQGGCFLRRSSWKKLKFWQYATTNLNVHMLTTMARSDNELLEGFTYNDLWEPAALSMTASKSTVSAADIDGEKGSQYPVSTGTPSEVVSKLPAPYASLVHYSYLRYIKQNAIHSNFEGINYKRKDDILRPENGPDDSASVDRNIHFIPLITLGVPAAHELGFREGGLKSLFSGVNSSDRVVKWLHAIQHPEIEPLLALRTEHPADFHSIFGKRASYEDDEGQTHLIQRKYKIAKRIDVCSSQILGFACTAIRAVLACAAQQPESIYTEIVRVSLKAGWLLTLQSLLSTSGDELGMIEDLECASLWLRGVKLRFMDATLLRHETPHSKKRDSHVGHEAEEEDHHVAGIVVWRDAGGQLIIDLELTDAREVLVVKNAVDFWARESAWLNEKEDPRFPRHVDVAGISMDLKAQGAKIEQENVFVEPVPTEAAKAHETKNNIHAIVSVGLMCTAFTIGVNEMQTIENAKSRMLTGTVQAQANINKSSLQALTTFWAGYHRFWMRMYNFQGLNMYGSRTVLATNSLFKDLENSVQRCAASPGDKHVSVLTSVSTFCRKVGGTIGILCKSGKDRTSMSSTLELARAVVDAHNVIDGQNVVDTMRMHGARRMNVWGNTGQSMFAFNALQRLALPTCYRPPLGTFSGSVNS